MSAGSVLTDVPFSFQMLVLCVFFFSLSLLLEIDQFYCSLGFTDFSLLFLLPVDPEHNTHLLVFLGDSPKGTT